MQLQLQDKFSKKQVIILFLILVLASIGLYFGWRIFWFLTDDAYIAFRYVSNSLLGYGYTWNLPPFRPVEGYTSFLWVVLLDVVWRVSGIAPPESSNVISLLFAYGTTFLGVVMLLKMTLREQLRKIRLLLLVLILLGVLTNRTYLTWTSSGLETAMFNFFMTAWVFVSLFVQSDTPQWLGWMTLISVLTTLTRPDGLLLIAATLFLGALTFLNWRQKDCLHVRYFFLLSPFLITLIHFLWRKQKYGEWLPNTYAAKQVAPWPESGLRYFLSFVIEYALWFWLALIFLFLLVQLRSLWQRYLRPGSQIRLLKNLSNSFVVDIIVIGTLFAHFMYYTLVIGGDHFEYRVYSHLILFIFISTVWLLNALNASLSQILIFLSLFILCALPIQWTHWAVTRKLYARQETQSLQVPISAKFPEVIQPYVTLYDNLQFWLIEHNVCARHQEHKVFHQFQTNSYPSRSEGFLLSPNNQIMSTGSVGVPGWVLPTTNILDTFGLNDYVIARNPAPTQRFRTMAHDRQPPVGYVECFQPNVELINNKLVIAQRDGITKTIINCENQEWAPSLGDRKVTGNNISRDAPKIDDYLWHTQFSTPTYFYFVPPEKVSAQLNELLLDAFPDYTGLGCIVVPPAKQLPSYLLAFLPPLHRPPLSDLAVIFPWTQFVRERWGEQSPAYNLGYASPIESDVCLHFNQSRTASWESWLSLLDYDLLRTDYHPGELLHLTLYYRVEDALSPLGQSHLSQV